MERLLSAGLKISKIFYVISGVTIVFMMMLTIFDVIFRIFDRPITGTYELVGYSGAILVGFALPYASWTRGHIYMEFIIDHVPKRFRNMANIFTRIIGLALIGLAAYGFIGVGLDIYKSGEASPTLQLPIYPFAFGVSLCFLILCYILFCDILKITGGKYE